MESQVKLLRLFDAVSKHSSIPKPEDGRPTVGHFETGIAQSFVHRTPSTGYSLSLKGVPQMFL